MRKQRIRCDKPSLYIIAVDPGLGGAVAIFNTSSGSMRVYETPVFKNKKNGKEDFDLPAMAELLLPFQQNRVLFIIEAVHAMPGQGGVSMFNFGRGKGIWEGMAAALGFSIIAVSPQTWKKEYTGLIVQREIKDSTLKLSKKEIAALSKEERKAYRIKEKEYKKEAAKRKRLAKAAAKSKARELAGILYPGLKTEFVLVNSDGKAEAVLIAEYAKRHYKEWNNEK